MLTRQQRTFCHLMAAGTEALQAYRRAYRCPALSDTLIERRAAALLNRPLVSAYLEKLKAAPLSLNTTAAHSKKKTTNGDKEPTRGARGDTGPAESQEPAQRKNHAKTSYAAPSSEGVIPDLNVGFQTLAQAGGDLVCEASHSLGSPEKGAHTLPLTVGDLIDELEQARTAAMDAGQTSAAISAIMGKAKLLGLGTENVDIKTPKIELVRFVD